MESYREMYFLLFNEMSKAIELMQNAQRAAEELFICANEPACVQAIDRDDETGGD